MSTEKVNGLKSASLRERDAALRKLLWQRPVGLRTADVATALAVSPAGARRRLRDAEARGVVIRDNGRWRPCYVAPEADRFYALVEVLGLIPSRERVEMLHAAAVYLGDEHLAQIIPKFDPSRRE